MSNVLNVDLFQAATNFTYVKQLTAFPRGGENVTFQSFDPTFGRLLGPSPSYKLLSLQSYAAFHEGGLYHQPTNSLYIASAWADDLKNPINMTIVSLPDYKVTVERYPGYYSGNGATNYIPPGGRGPPQLVFCDKGLQEKPSGLVLIDPVKKTATTLVNNFRGREFNAVNDVRQHHITGDLWFTDSPYGFLQGFRPAPNTPNQVYRFEPATGNIQVVADGFTMTNGLEFSPDFKTLYVSDTGANLVNYGGFNYSRPATVYAYDISYGRYASNKRVFAYMDAGLPDGMHTDTDENLWVASSSGDGVHVFNKYGKLLGKVRIEGGASNFQFTPEGIVVNNEERLFLVKLAARGRELARDYGHY